MTAALYRLLRESLEAEELVVLVTRIGSTGSGLQLLIWPDGRMKGDLGRAELNQQAAACVAADGPLASRRQSLGPDDESAEVFLQVYSPPAKLILVGAVHVAVELVKFAKVLGYHTIVVDPRPSFANRERFPEADQLLLQWPDEALSTLALNDSTAVAVLSHDLKLDVPALKVALPSHAGYIGALGSRKTHRKRVEALQEAGFSEDQLARIHAPIGLDLGGRQADQIALAIMAEIVASRHGRTA